LTKEGMNMKKFWIAAMAAALITVGAVAQTSASGLASGNASVTPGQANVGASANQSAQTPNGSANVGTSVNANANASQEHDSKKKDSGSTNSAGVSGGNATSAVAGTGGTHPVSAGLNSGTAMQAELTKSIDAKKVKSGDEVTAKLTQDVKSSDGKVVMHKGSKLVGHVTEAQARSKENAESKLGIVFDKAVLKGGQEMAFNGTIQALAPPVQGAASVAGDESSSLGSGLGNGTAMGGGRSGGGLSSPLGGGGAVGGGALSSTTGAVGRTAGSVSGSATGAVNGSVNNTVGAAANGTLNTASRGVVGMQGMVLNTAAVGSAQGSVLTSADRNIKLDSGTRMVLQVAGSASAQ
jgi:hypothetical protein